MKTIIISPKNLSLDRPTRFRESGRGFRPDDGTRVTAPTANKRAGRLEDKTEPARLRSLRPVAVFGHKSLLRPVKLNANTRCRA